MLRWWMLLAGTVLFVANASASPVRRIEDATLVGVSGAWRISAGVVLTLVRLDLLNNGVRAEVYAVQLHPNEVLPAVGAICSIEASRRRVDGATADGRAVRGEVLFADHIRCDGQDYLSDA
jgi:hypothetical protein